MENGLRNHKNIKAMIAVQPLQYQKFVDAFGMPKFLQRSSGKLNKERTGIDMVNKSFLSDVGQINVPTLVVQNSNDPWTEMSFVDTYYANLTVEKKMLLLDLEKNRFAAYEHLGSNRNGIYEWFDKHM
jgi:esterase/lipase